MHTPHWHQGENAQPTHSKLQEQTQGDTRKTSWKHRVGPTANKFLLATTELAENYQEEGDNWEEESPANELDQEEGCPMILSHINHPPNPRYNNLAILRIRNAASELMQCHYDLADYLVDVEHDLKQFCLQMAQGLELIVEKANRDMQYRVDKGQDFKTKEALLQAQEMVNKLTSENEALQERIFDLEQRIVGVELQVDRRLKQRGRQAERQAAALARQQSRETTMQLHEEVASLKEKCLELQSHAHPEDLRQRQYQLKEAEAQLFKQRQELRQEYALLQMQKQAAYQREHELISGEQNLTRKIAQLRKKESELSEWQAQLTRKNRKAAVQSQLVDEMSRDELNNSEQISLKSFGRRPKEEQLRIATTSLEQLGIHRKRNLNNQQQPQTPRDPLQIVRQRKQARLIGQSYARREAAEPARRFNTQISNYQASREASPYRALQDLKSRGGNQYSHQYFLPKNSPRQPRDISKHSNSSVSRSRAARTAVDEGGLGSKLSRLREEIKKQIESIK